jgi:hypothetical protein
MAVASPVSVTSVVMPPPLPCNPDIFKRPVLKRKCGGGEEYKERGEKNVSVGDRPPDRPVLKQQAMLVSGDSARIHQRWWGVFFGGDLQALE